MEPRRGRRRPRGRRALRDVRARTRRHPALRRHLRGPRRRPRLRSDGRAMSRTRLSLYRLDPLALRSFGTELRECFAKDNRASLVALLDLHGDLAGRIERAPHAVDPFLVPDTYPVSTPL